MNKDWFPFFSMLLWFVTKTTGLSLLLLGFVALLGMLSASFAIWNYFGNLLFMAVAPMAAGYLLLVTDVVHDLATAGAKRRLAK